MGTSNQQKPHPADIPILTSVLKGRSFITKRRTVQVMAVCVLIALAGWVGYLIHPTSDPSTQDSQIPSFIPLPSHASLVRTETFLKEHIQNWYYTIPQISENQEEGHLILSWNHGRSLLVASGRGSPS